MKSERRGFQKKLSRKSGLATVAEDGNTWIRGGNEYIVYKGEVLHLHYKLHLIYPRFVVSGDREQSFLILTRRNRMRVTDDYVFFWGSYLSNFWLCPIESTKEMAVPGLSFVCSEQAFMVEKASFFKDQDTLKKCFYARMARRLRNWAVR